MKKLLFILILVTSFSIYSETNYNSKVNILLTKKLYIKKTGLEENVIIGYLFLRTSAKSREESMSSINKLIKIVDEGYTTCDKILVSNFSFIPYDSLRYVDEYTEVNMDEITTKSNTATNTEIFLYTAMGDSWENQGNQLDSGL
ncbi:MAG: hypothetical protein OCD02_09590 [Spirochaetaceae bacterium]